jgi:alpha-beta hydrolase superfamily lysophospholipase
MRSSMTTPRAEIRDGYFTSSDGLQLYYRERILPDAMAHILLVHGLGEHYGRYRDTEAFLAERGIGLSMMDLRGHGQSEGKRVFTPTFEHYLDDLDRLSAHVAAHAERLFLVGHSLGGVIAIRYAETRRPAFRGLITSGAALKSTIQPPKPVFAALQQINKLYPATPVPGLVKPERLSRDAKVVARYKRDPLVPKHMTTQFGLVVLDACDVALSEANRVALPTLVMHGGSDSVASPAGSEAFFCGLEVADKSIAIYPALYHEIFNEPERESVLSDLTQWIRERAST